MHRTLKVVTATTATRFGVDLLVNGDFDDAALGWALGTGWTISSGQLVGTGVTSGNEALGTLKVPVVVGARYDITYTVTFTGGGMGVGIGGVLGSVRSSNGTYTDTLTATTTGGLRITRRTTDFTGTVDNITVKRIS